MRNLLNCVFIERCGVIKRRIRYGRVMQQAWVRNLYTD
jgi:hypothetical protein